ncbi:MAG TPA: hypothetical protein PK536_11020 [Ignavibacteria bacterium]|nr:hypothetical protein [Ignavibacteria bacterium]HRJ99102.1 hypothetical protein [Ignavibacteria bacterium]
MKIYITVIVLLIVLLSDQSSAQEIKLKLNNKQPDLYNLSLKDETREIQLPPLPSSGASMGFNLGLASIEGKVGFAVGAFAELKTGGFSFVPQANYWSEGKQNNFELAGLARFYLSPQVLMPYLDGGLGVNFYNSDKENFSKLSILIGGGVELTNLGTSFNLIFDGKYKLIINDQNNISCFVFTAGMKFPFK